MIRKWFGGLLSMLLLAAALQGQSRESLFKSITEASNWTPIDQPNLYDEKTIESFAGKRAAAITQYGLTGVTVQNFSSAEGSVRLTLYEMIDSSAAYGLFSLERNSGQPGYTTIPLGTEGFRTGNRIFLWQSKYVVKLEGSTAATDSLGKLISENIVGRSRKPPVSNHLPASSLVQGSEKYIDEPTSIRGEAGIDPDKLGFDSSVEIAMADYRVNGKPARLVLLMYPTQQIAKKFADQWDTESPADAAFRKRAVRLVALVRGTRDEDVAKSILDGVNLESQVTWNEGRPDLQIGQVIITIFTFIGVALLFTLVVGIGFGGLRLFVKAKYPDRVFDRPEDMEVIQLKLGQGVIRKELPE